MIKILTGQWLTQIFDRALSLGLIWGFSGEGIASKASAFIAIGALPHLFFSALSAKVIAKWGHRRVMLTTEVLRFLLLLIFCSIYQNNKATFFTGYAVFYLTFLLNSFAAFYNTAVLSAPRYFVEESKVERVTSLINTGFSLSSVVGPIAFSLLFVRGMESLLFVAALSYLLSAILLLRLKSLPLPFGNEAAAKISSLPKFIFILLGLFALMNLFLGPLQVFIPIFAKESQAGLADYARFEFLLAVGLLLGSFLAVFPRINKIQNKNSFLIFLFWILGVSYFVFTKFPFGIWIYTSLFTMGVSLGLANVLLLSYLQFSVPLIAVPALMAAVNLISTASLPVSMAMTSFFMRDSDPRQFSLQCAVFFIFIVIVFQLVLKGRDGIKKSYA